MRPIRPLEKSARRPYTVLQCTRQTADGPLHLPSSQSRSCSAASDIRHVLWHTMWHYPDMATSGYRRSCTFARVAMTRRSDAASMGSKNSSQSPERQQERFRERQQRDIREQTRMQKAIQVLEQSQLDKQVQ